MEKLKEEFDKLNEEWQKNTCVLSNVHTICKHLNYRKIVDMGEPVIFFILKMFQEILKSDVNEPHWHDRFGWGMFPMLCELTGGKNAVREEHAGKIYPMMQDWVNWGKKHKYLTLEPNDNLEEIENIKEDGTKMFFWPETAKK